MRALLHRFKDWQGGSLLRRTMVTVASFTMLACVSIATMSFVAVSATKAVFKPAAEPALSSPGAPGAAPSGTNALQVAKNGKADKPAKTD